ncbi:MAG TPA: hypothetical protein DD649_09785 [Providencia sp.]|nr:hypothetical protein [Providencia sp.]
MQKMEFKHMMAFGIQMKPSHIPQGSHPVIYDVKTNSYIIYHNNNRAIMLKSLLSHLLFNFFTYPLFFLELFLGEHTNYLYMTKLSFQKWILNLFF